MASACCKAAQVLHTNKLVHRDFRLPNVVQLAHQQYMVIDLESVADVTAKRLPENFHNVLKTCNAEALDADGHFTPLSDMYCIGVLLTEAHIRVSSQAATFTHKLLDKELTAEATSPGLLSLKTCTGQSASDVHLEAELQILRGSPHILPVCLKPGSVLELCG